MDIQKMEDLQTKMQEKIKKCEEEIEKYRNICIAMMKDQENDDYELERLTYKFHHMHPNHPEYRDIEAQKHLLQESRKKYEKTVREIYFKQDDIARKLRCYQSELSQIININ